MKTLVNAIPNEDGVSGLNSVVVTMGDLALLDEVEQRRTGFFALMSP